MKDDSTRGAAAGRGVDEPALTLAETAHLPGLAVRSGLALLAVLVAVVPYLFLWFLVSRSWGPLTGLDASVADALNKAVSDDGSLVEALRSVTDLGGTTTTVIVMTGATVLLGLRRRWRPALFLTVTGVGLLVLIPLTKAIADRARPVVDVAVVAPPENASFPSGHAMSSVVVWGALALVALPVVPRRARPWLYAGVTSVVLAVGLTRLALGVHFVSDVIAGWVLGAAWLAATGIAFWTWERSSGRDPAPAQTLAPGHDLERRLAGQAADSRPSRRELACLALAALGLFVALAAAGRLVAGAGPGTVWHAFDQWALELLAYPRDNALTDVAEVVGHLASSSAVVAIGLALVVLATTLPRPSRAVLFVTLAVLGEVILYFAVSRFVGRERPDLGSMAPGLPAEASWPSGHAAAAVAVYGALAILVGRGSSRSLGRTAALVPIVVAPLVAWSRVYLGEHYPSDVLAGMALGALWVLACTLFVLTPGRLRASSSANTVTTVSEISEGSTASPPSTASTTARSRNHAH